MTRTLTPSEADELKQLEAALLWEETQALHAADAQVDKRIKHLETQNHELETVLAEKEALADRLAAAVRSFQSERRALNTRLKRIVAVNSNKHTTAPGR